LPHPLPSSPPLPHPLPSSARRRWGSDFDIGVERISEGFEEDEHELLL
jgi:hypothetical protein